MLKHLNRAMTVAVMILGAAAVPAGAKNLSLGSTNATSSHYQIAVAMGKAIEAGMSGTTVTVVETGASVDNVRRLMRGEIDLGLVAGDVFVQARNGTGQFKGHAVKDLVALYPYDDSILNIAVRADSITASGLRCAPPTGSVMMPSMTPNPRRSCAVIFMLVAASCARPASFQRIAAAASGEATV